jgi:hypothetical protein
MRPAREAAAEGLGRALLLAVPEDAPAIVIPYDKSREREETIQMKRVFVLLSILTLSLTALGQDPLKVASEAY